MQYIELECALALCSGGFRKIDKQSVLVKIQE